MVSVCHRPYKYIVNTSVNNHITQNYHWPNFGVRKQSLVWDNAKDLESDCEKQWDLATTYAWKLTCIDNNVTDILCPLSRGLPCYCGKHCTKQERFATCMHRYTPVESGGNTISRTGRLQFGLARVHCSWPVGEVALEVLCYRASCWYTMYIAHFRMLCATSSIYSYLSIWSSFTCYSRPYTNTHIYIIIKDGWHLDKITLKK